jgi:hypothetical protein
MQERPIILFPSPEKADRETKTPFFSKVQKPSFGRQYNRLQPTFCVLQSTFEQKNLKIQQSPVGINPDFALVFEIVGTVSNFYTAVKKCDGLEWMFDKDYDNFEPDDDFYEIDETGKRTTEALNGKLYCVMTNQQAMTQLLSLWQRHQNGETEVFKHGFSGLRDIFVNIKNIRKWNAQDRISETFAIEYWEESLSIDGDSAVPFEIELFFRSDDVKRKIATQTITYEVNKLNGKVLQECIISGISYHALLVELPRNSIESLVNNYDSIELTQVDDIMFFRPTCQSAFIANTNTQEFEPVVGIDSEITALPVAAVLDGMPMQNHALLQNRLIIDDPDDYATGYESKYRIHGTSMSSLVIYGDLNRNEKAINSPVYVRPILKPKQVGIDNIDECIPDDVLFVDVLHRAILRMTESNGTDIPVAPSVKIINLSVGDPVRQLVATMSPVARLLDYLAYKYKLLFIISAGNHPAIINMVSSKFAELKAASIQDRSKAFFNVIRDNQRNMKVLSPAESINSITVGALYDDFCNTNESDRFIYAVEKGLPSPASSFGKGYRSMITPDLFYYGGRKFIRGNIKDNVDWALSNREPGCKVAAPYGANVSSGQAFSFGTSDAAAQMTHEAVKCFNTLTEIFISETGSEIPNDYKANLVKAMLAHGATWENISEQLSAATSDSPKQLTKWIGNGVPDVDKVQSCTINRITLIGIGSLKKDEGDVFHLPLPVDFSSQLVKRRLTVTLAYISPTSPDRQLYRTAQLWFNVEDEKGLVPDRQNTEWQAVRKGTLQHEIFIGENPVVWNDDDIIIKVNCKEEAGKFKESIPYCLFVSFEVAEGLNIDLYTKVATKIKPPVSISNI